MQSAMVSRRPLPSGTIDSLIASAAVSPIQFHHIWNETRVRTGEQHLALAVLTQAVEDLQKHRCARRRKRQRLYMETYRWVASDDRNWPYSFANICEMLNLQHEAIRAQVLSPAFKHLSAAA